MTFNVQKKACSTCIYRKDTPLSIPILEAAISDGQGGFKGWRVCHHSSKGGGVCCRGFWNKHKDKFNLGRIAQRLKAVKFVHVDDMQLLESEEEFLLRHGQFNELERRARTKPVKKEGRDESN